MNYSWMHNLETCFMNIHELCCFCFYIPPGLLHVSAYKIQEMQEERRFSPTSLSSSCLQDELFIECIIWKRVSYIFMNFVVFVSIFLQVYCMWVVIKDKRGRRERRFPRTCLSSSCLQDELLINRMHNLETCFIHEYSWTLLFLFLFSSRFIACEWL